MGMPIHLPIRCDLANTFCRTEIHRRTFTWEAINYHVPVPGGTKRLLHDVYGYVKPGTLTALMGASGAGETFPNSVEH